MSDLATLPIVVVEDDVDVLSLIGSLLRAHYPHEVTMFEDSRKALDFLRSSEAAVVILDLSMPEVSGLDLLHYIRSEKPHLPTVIVTGERQLETAIECMKLGAVDYLTKPIHVERLIASVASALTLQHTAGERPSGRSTPDADVSGGLIPEGVPERLLKAARYMELHLSQDMYLEAVAREACLSKYHFAREFKKYFGVSPIQFMLRLRIALACSRLMSGEIPVSRVATECGFSDQSEFTKWFKKSTGVTPSKFRRSLGLAQGAGRVVHH